MRRTDVARRARARQRRVRRIRVLPRHVSAELPLPRGFAGEQIAMISVAVLSPDGSEAVTVARRAVHLMIPARPRWADPLIGHLESARARRPGATGKGARARLGGRQRETRDRGRRPCQRQARGLRSRRGGPRGPRRAPGRPRADARRGSASSSTPRSRRATAKRSWSWSSRRSGRSSRDVRLWGRWCKSWPVHSRDRPFQSRHRGLDRLAERAGPGQTSTAERHRLGARRRGTHRRGGDPGQR